LIGIGRSFIVRKANNLVIGKMGMITLVLRWSMSSFPLRIASRAQHAHCALVPKGGAGWDFGLGNNMKHCKKHVNC